ncbi:MAG: ATP-binding cassette domain-containing protein [Pseudomonadota bacterium]
MPILELRGAQLAFGHIPLLDDASLLIEPRERICLVGRNGTGKSTLLNVISGAQDLDAGSLWLADGIKVAKLAQEVPAGGSDTIYATVASGLGDISGVLARYHALTADMSGDPDENLRQLGEVQAEIDRLDAWEAAQKVDTVLSRLRLPTDALMSACSGGIRRRAMLAQALVDAPDLLLLDEPTNHLDIDSITALESAVAEFVGAILFITHDRTFTDTLATRIIELDRGVLTAYPGSYAEYQARKEADLAVEADHNAKFDKVLATEEVWIRQGIKARRTRNEGRVRRLEALRRERAARLERQGRVKLSVDQGRDSGKLVIDAEDVGFQYGDETIIQHFSTTILRGDRIGIIGPNGSGKSTLLKLLLGQLVPATGTIKQGTQLNVAYFDQEREQIDPERTVKDNLADGNDQVQIGDKSKHVISYLRDFLFAPERANSPAKTLSGGERNRLLLAKLFTKPANVLVLDEPTNDLDVDTLELLEELLSDFSGTLLLVSHDRSFLDKTVTSTLVLAGGGRVESYVGGYSDWLQQRPEQTPNKTNSPTASAPRPKRRDQAGKLSYNESRELAGLPEQIERLEAQQAQISEEVAQSDFYQQHQDAIEATMTRLADVNAALEQAYERWTELEEKGGG